MPEARWRAAQPGAAHACGRSPAPLAQLSALPATHSLPLPVPDPSPPPQPCPTEPLTALVGPDGSPLDALNSALSNALQQVAVPAAAINSATFEKSLKRLAVSNPGGDLFYYVSDGKGAWEAARSAEEACAPKDEACLAPKECKEGWYRTTDAAALCALCMAGHTCEGGQPSPCPPGSAAEWAGSTSCAPCEVNTYADTKGNSHCDSW